MLGGRERRDPARRDSRSRTATELFAGPRADQKAPDWVKGRVGLLGDELSRVNGPIAPLELELFEKRYRDIVDAMHTPF